MKTLKKTLCLVLAVVMVVGVLILPASAADYEDDAEITHKEAVAVLSKLEILTGNAGSYHPDETLSRAEAASIISKLAQTPAVANRYPKGQTTGFADVDSNDSFDWATGFIAYCATKGIISGNGTNYYPLDKLTGTAFAKMLLCTVGYNAETEGFVGNLWAVNVIGTAISVGLDEGIEDFDYDAPLSRDDAAQMAYNALMNVNTVTYPDGVLKVGETTLKSKYSVTVAETLGHDETGVPETKVVNIKDEPAFVTYAEPVKTYNTAKTFKEIIKDIKGEDAVEADFFAKYYVDGVRSKYADKTAWDDANAADSIGDTTADACALGSTTTVYTVKEGGKDVYYIVRLTDKYVPVTADNYKDGILTLDADAKLTTKIETKTDDVVIYNTGMKDGKKVVVGDPYVASVVEGPITAKSNDDTNKYIRIDNSTEQFKAVSTDEAQAVYGLDLSDEVEYTFHLDKNNNIVKYGVKKNETGTGNTETKYVYVLSYAEQAYEEAKTEQKDIFGKVTQQATPGQDAAAAVVVMDLETGKVGTKNLLVVKSGEKYYLTDGDGNADTTKEIDGKETDITAGFYSYKEDAGYYKLTPATSAEVEYETAKAATMTVNDVTKYLNSTTKLTVYTHDAKTEDNGLDDVFTVAPYTGYTSFPAVTGTQEAALVLTDTAGTTVTAAYVVITSGTTSSGDDDEAADTDIAIYVSKGEQTTTGTTYNFLVAGELKSYVSTNNNLSVEAGKVYKLSFGTDGKLTGADPAANPANGTLPVAITLGTSDYLVFEGSETPVMVGGGCVVVNAVPDANNVVSPKVDTLPDLSKKNVTVDYYTTGEGDNAVISLIIIRTAVDKT